MTKPQVFPLRLKDDRLRALAREVASQEGLSQNELFEQAIEHELVTRGALLADDLAASARRLAALSDDSYARLLRRGMDRFVAGEARPEPVQARRTAAAAHGFDVVAAFEAARVAGG